MLRSRRFLFLSGLLLLGGGAAAALIAWAGDQLASPPRRTLMDYHGEILDDPAARGMSIDRFTASDGTPCLICTPSGVPGTRGTTLRRQLEERNLPLHSFGTVTGNLVLLHGRTGRKEDFLPVAERFCAAGFRCIIPDLPGHGEHPTKVITYGVREAVLPERVLDEAAGKLGFNKHPCGLVGMSMGGSVAVHAAARPGAPWKSLVVIASFDALESAVSNQATRRVGQTISAPWIKGVAMVYESQAGIPLASIRPCEQAGNILIPTMVAHGTKDTIIPMASGRALHDALTSCKERQWIEVPGADHDNVLITSHPIYADTAGWLLRHL